MFSSSRCRWELTLSCSCAWLLCWPLQAIHSAGQNREQAGGLQQHASQQPRQLTSRFISLKTVLPLVHVAATADGCCSARRGILFRMSFSAIHVRPHQVQIGAW